MLVVHARAKTKAATLPPCFPCPVLLLILSPSLSVSLCRPTQRLIRYFDFYLGRLEKHLHKQTLFLPLLYLTLSLQVYKGLVLLLLLLLYLCTPFGHFIPGNHRILTIIMPERVIVVGAGRECEPHSTTSTHSS